MLQSNFSWQPQKTRVSSLQGETLERFRELLELAVKKAENPSQLAAMLGVTPSYISRWRDPERNIEPSFLSHLALAKFMGMLPNEYAAHLLGIETSEVRSHFLGERPETEKSSKHVVDAISRKLPTLQEAELFAVLAVITSLLKSRCCGSGNVVEEPQATTDPGALKEIAAKIAEFGVDDLILAAAVIGAAKIQSLAKEEHTNLTRGEADELFYLIGVRKEQVDALVQD